MKIKSVSQTLFKPNGNDNFVLKLSVSILDSKGIDSFYNIFEQPHGSYLTMNLNPSIVLQYKIGSIYDASHIVRVTIDEMFGVTKFLKEFYTRILRVDMYSYYKSGSVRCNARRDDTRTHSLRNGGFLTLVPDVIIDTNTNKSLPGVILYINNTNNKIDLSIDEYETILYIFDKIDLYGMAYHLIMSKWFIEDKIKQNTGFVTRQETMQPTGINIFQKAEENKNLEGVYDGRVINNKPTSIDQLM